MLGFTQLKGRLPDERRWMNGDTFRRLPSRCRGGYQPPATFRFPSGGMNGITNQRCTNSPYRIQKSCVVPHGRLIASPTGAVLHFWRFLNQRKDSKAASCRQPEFLIILLRSTSPQGASGPGSNKRCPDTSGGKGTFCAVIRRKMVCFAIGDIVT